MSRPRAFIDHDVRDRVADVFTAHGYHGTSLAMLTEASGLGKQSLYNAFGDKQALYLQALDCVGERWAVTAAKLAQAKSGRAAVNVFFDDVLQVCTSADASVHSCIVSAGLLEAIDDAVVAERLRQKWCSTESLLRQCIERGRHDGSIRKDVPAADLARLLMTLMSGLRVTARATARTTPDARQLKATLRLALQVLEPTT
jgi:TetR/AcrR family transcriptional regulator, transcriptional repressor for nem operon